MSAVYPGPSARGCGEGAGGSVRSAFPAIAEWPTGRPEFLDEVADGKRELTRQPRKVSLQTPEVLESTREVVFRMPKVPESPSEVATRTANVPESVGEVVSLIREVLRQDREIA